MTRSALLTALSAALALAFSMRPSAGADEPFPIAVWLRFPDNAERCREIGIDTYVALWNGPTEEKQDRFDAAGMKVIVNQTEQSLRFKDDRPPRLGGTPSMGVCPRPPRHALRGPRPCHPTAEVRSARIFLG